MANLYEVQGFYGLGKTPTATTIFVYEKRNGGKWYVAWGSTNINLTYDDIELGTNIETLRDSDFQEATRPVNDLEDLEREIEE